MFMAVTGGTNGYNDGCEFQFIRSKAGTAMGIHAAKMMSCTSDLAGAEEPRLESGYRVHAG